MHLLHGTVAHYDWGDTEALPDFLGALTNGKPWAELWFGTHPGGPSQITTTTGTQPLSDVVGELSFLVKVIAAAQPLSLQTPSTWVPLLTVSANALTLMAMVCRVGCPMGRRPAGSACAVLRVRGDAAVCAAVLPVLMAGLESALPARLGFEDTDCVFALRRVLGMAYVFLQA